MVAGMEAQQLARCVHDAIERYGYIDISHRELQITFRQPERKTSFGDALMNLAGLPTERETFMRWLRVNQWMEIVTSQPDIIRIVKAPER